MKDSPSQEKKNDFDEVYSNVLFVADLPKETTDEDLNKLFQNYHVQRSYLNCSKTIWAQVYLENKEWATKARHELNGHVLIPKNAENQTKGRPIRICKYEGKASILNKQTNLKQSLLVKNIDINITQKEFYKMFLEYGDISSAKLEYDENGTSKGYGYIYYFTEEAAENAKKNLNGKIFYGKALEIVNLIPAKKNRGNSVTLFVLNLPNTISDDELKEIFDKYGTVTNIAFPRKGYAFVTFSNLDSASRCFTDLKNNPLCFQGLNSVVVKYASSKEEREANKAFLSKREKEENEINLSVQFNLLYSQYSQEIKNEAELEKEIRLFIKAVLLMEYNPKEVLVDIERMSGLVTFDKSSEYKLFFNKYNEFCRSRQPLFQCITYYSPKMNQEENGYPMPYNNQNQNNYPPNGIPPKVPNFSTPPIGFMPPVMRGGNNMYMPNGPNGYGPNNKFYYKNNNNNNGFIPNPSGMVKNNININNNQRNMIPNNSPNYYSPQIYGDSYNINITMNSNNNKPQPNMPPVGLMNPMNNPRMRMILNQRNMQAFAPVRMNLRPGYANPNMRNNYINANRNYRNDDNERKIEHDVIDERGKNETPLERSQFKSPPISYVNFNDKETEEIVNELADSIYDIVSNTYPKDAAKITGMIKEMGIEKMNLLLSKKEDLYDIIEKAHEMLNNNKEENMEENKNEENNDN